MLKRRLGNTGMAVSPLGLGTVKFGRNTGVGYPRSFELPSDGQIADLLGLAKDLGINLLDTAPAYGASEARLGEAIEGQRRDWVLCTKVGEQFDGVRSRYDFSEDHVLASVAGSLGRLRTDTLDVVLLHADGRCVAQIETAGAFRALARLRREGVVRAVGFSGKTDLDGRAALPRSDVLMCSINRDYRDEVALAAEAQCLEVGVLVKKPLAQGFDADSSALAEIVNLPGVTSAVVGTTSVAHLAANVAAVEEATAVREP